MKYSVMLEVFLETDYKKEVKNDATDTYCLHNGSDLTNDRLIIKLCRRLITTCSFESDMLGQGIYQVNANIFKMVYVQFVCTGFKHL